MPEYCVGRASKILNRYKIALNGSKILVLGVAYKQDINDYRESPALKVIDLLIKQCADVSFFDPYISEYKYNGKKHFGLSTLSSDILKSVDLVMITTCHTNVDYDFVQKNASFVFDTKNAMKHISERVNIELL
jgi:UDP-N-acetyl-D-glucosamine dehydrogenase